MPLYNTHVPIPPGPKARPNAVREGDTIKALSDTRSVLSRLVALLGQYSPKFITDAKGYRLEVLGKDMGKWSVGATELSHPWKIHLGKFGTPAEWKVGVDYHSDVYDGVTWTKQTVTGLLTDPSDPADAGWKSPQVGYVFLWGQLDESGAITSIEVKNDQDELDPDAMLRVKAVDGKQTEFIWVIGYLWSSGAGENIRWYYRQECNRHVTLLHVVVNGVLCKVPFEM